MSLSAATLGPIERNEALVDVETPPLNIKFGVNYIASPSR